jgi:hypothetical protein
VTWLNHQNKIRSSGGYSEAIGFIDGDMANKVSQFELEATRLL